MKSNQKLSILIWLKRLGATQKDEKAPLYARVTIDGKDKEISINRKVHPDFWDVENKRDTQPGAEAKKTNTAINETLTSLEDHFRVLRSQYEVVTPLMLKNVYSGKPAMAVSSTTKKNKIEIQSLIPAFDQFIKVFDGKVKKGLRSDGTLRHWNTTKGKVLSFLKYQYKAKDINLSEIDYSFAEGLYNYLTLFAAKPLAEATAKTHVKKTRQILAGYVKKKVISTNPLEGFSCGSPIKDVVPLELFEVEAIYRKPISINRLMQVRDSFIFQCFTGFAYQDIYDLSPENIIRVGNNGERWLIKDRGKTGVSEMVPILPIVEELICKYEDHTCRTKNNKLMPVNSNYRYNVYLKELKDICSIQLESLTSKEFNTHLARHTFADIMLNNGVPLEDVSKMLGHKNIRTTQRYCKVKKPRISQSMAMVKSILFDKSGALKRVS